MPSGSDRPRCNNSAEISCGTDIMEINRDTDVWQSESVRGVAEANRHLLINYDTEHSEILKKKVNHFT
jgi:hypothetical protein